MCKFVAINTTNYEMQLNTIASLIYRHFSIFISSLIILFIFFACAEEPQIWKTKSKDLVATDYIASIPEEYSEFSKLIEEAGFSSLLKVRGPYTIMLPNNDAMFEYYKKKVLIHSLILLLNL